MQKFTIFVVMSLSLLFTSVNTAQAQIVNPLDPCATVQAALLQYARDLYDQERAMCVPFTENLAQCELDASLRYSDRVTWIICYVSGCYGPTKPDCGPWPVYDPPITMTTTTADSFVGPTNFVDNEHCRIMFIMYVDTALNQLQEELEDCWYLGQSCIDEARARYSARLAYYECLRANCENPNPLTHRICTNPG